MRSTEKYITPDSEYYVHIPSENTRRYLLHCLVCGNYHYEGGYDLVRSSYDSFQLKVITEGTMTLEIDNRVMKAQAGDIVIIDCYKPHRYYSTTGCRSVWIHFDGASARGYYNLITRINGNVLTTRHTSFIRKKLESILQAYKDDSAVNEADIAFQIVTVLNTLTDPIRTEMDTGTKNNVEKLLRHINEIGYKRMSVREMAEMTGISVYHFIRVFTEITGVTPKQYVLSIRINKAKNLLSSSDVPLSAIAKQLGYQSESAFSTAFKNYLGKTPSEYRSICLIEPEKPSHGFPAPWISEAEE